MIEPNEEGSGLKHPRSAKYTTRMIEKALTGNGGVMSRAAEALGCTWQTVRKRVDKSPRLQRAMWAARERAGDMAEHTLMMALEVENRLVEKALEAVERGSTTPDMPRLTSTIFLSKTINRSRGYSQVHEVTGPGGEPLVPGGSFVVMRTRPVVKDFDEWRTRHRPADGDDGGGGSDEEEAPVH
jgi:hypothetical protein